MTENDTDALWLRIALTPDVHPRLLPTMLERFSGPEGILAADLMELAAAGIPRKSAAALAAQDGRPAAEAELQRARSEGIDILTYDAPRYPELLRQITDPPFVLFSRGKPGGADCVAVVGSRDASAYGAQVAHRLAGDLAARGLTVVSGLARGIDQAAHNGALEAGGSTIAVLGSGFGNIYPRGCERLIERIEASGALITEFAYDVAPARHTFPQRNRIISGMSYATLVVEASERSGALITARYALEQGRELLAVPGQITSRRCIGTNYMIKKGAKLVQRAEDVIDELPARVAERLKEVQRAPEPELSTDERLVMEALAVDSPKHIDIIASHLDMSSQELAVILLGLEMRSLVRQLPGMEYLKAL